jgi:hypothetical protein
MNIDSLFPSKYFRADDAAQPRVLTISGITVEEFGDDRQKKPVLHFLEDSRGLVCNKTNAGIIAHVLGKDTDNWMQRQIELRAEAVPFQGRIVDAIRVRVVQPPAAPVTAVAAPQSPPVSGAPIVAPTDATPQVASQFDV